MDQKTQDHYNKLKAYSQKASVLEGVSNLLHWDQETYMPPAGASFRAEQNTLLATLRHELLCSIEYRKTLANLIDLESGRLLALDLTADEQVTIRRWYDDWRKYSALPHDFVAEYATVTTQASEAWKEARREKRFSLFAPWLDKIVALNRRKAELIGGGDEPYDILLDLYEEGMKTSHVSALFDQVRSFLVELLKKIREHAQIDDSLLHGHFSPSSQMELGRQFLDAIGYDFHKGNLSLTTHPFCSGNHPNDCRVTTRLHESYFLSNIRTVLHEGGHALYNMQLPADCFGTPLGQDVSMGIHESQSRLWEVFIGGSKPFWSHFLKVVAAHYPQLRETPLDFFWRALNKVEPSFIRVEADEVTYPLHVILRFEIERGLLDGTMQVKELPEIWNAKMAETLGITPPDDALGCLQDIHWSLGSMGYFPTYLLGNIYAAQLWDAFRKENPTWSEHFSRGDLLFVKKWLSDKIHSHGRRYLSNELIQRATGTQPEAGFFCRYLAEKYGEIYSLDGALASAPCSLTSR